MSQQIINLFDLYPNLCAVSFKPILLTLRDLFYFLLSHLIFGSNLVNLTFYRRLLSHILFLFQIQLLKLFIRLLYFISHKMPQTEFLQCIISLMLFSQQ